MSTLRSEVIQRVYDECADFAARNGITEEEACQYAAKVGGWLSSRLNDSEWDELMPRFLFHEDGRVTVWATEVSDFGTLLMVQPRE